MVPLNNLLQPIKKARSLFNRVLAAVAKRPSLCPHNYEDWPSVPQYFRGQIIMFIRQWYTNEKRARGKEGSYYMHIQVDHNVLQSNGIFCNLAKKKYLRQREHTGE